MTSLVKVSHDVYLPPQSSTFCFVKVRQQQNKISKKSYCISQIDSRVLRDEPGIYPVEGVIYITSSRRFLIVWVNSTSSHFRIKRGYMIGELDEIDSICSVKSSLIKDINESMTGSNIHSEGNSHMVPEQYSQEINPILHHYNDIFSKNDRYIGETNLLKIKIELNVPPYRVPLHKREAVEKTLEDMLESGIVRPSISPYNAPVVAVKKPNSDSYRICIDFRAVNSITKPVAKP